MQLDGIVLQGAAQCGDGVGCSRCADVCDCLVPLRTERIGGSSHVYWAVLPRSASEYAGAYHCDMRTNMCNATLLQRNATECFASSSSSHSSSSD